MRRETDFAEKFSVLTCVYMYEESKMIMDFKCIERKRKKYGGEKIGKVTGSFRVTIYTWRSQEKMKILGK